MKPLHLGVLLVLLAGAPTWARLGETEEQLTARFGKPVSRAKHSFHSQGKFRELGPTLRFNQDGWIITSDLVEGRVVREYYGKPGDWTETQIQAVLAANSQGAKWTETSKAGAIQMMRSWKRTDGATAEWRKTSGLSFVSPAYERAKDLEEAKAKAETQRVPKI